MNFIICTATEYYQGGSTKEDQRGRAWSKHRGCEKLYTKFSVRKPPREISFWSPKRKWADNIKNYFKEI
jgi:hypothetical protein